MTAAARLAALFVVPAEALGDLVGADAGEVAPRRPELRVLTGHGAGTGTAGADAPAPPPEGRVGPQAAATRVCVLGGGRAVLALAHGLATRLAHDGGGACVVARTADTGTAFPRRPGPAGAAARRVARTLARPGGPVVAQGRLVLLPPSVAELPFEVPAPMLVLVEGARTEAHDELLRRSHLIVAVVPADAPEALATVAAAGLERLAPDAAVLAVPLPSRLGPAARRAAVTRVREALG